MTKDEWGTSCTNTICGHKSFSVYDGSYLFPLRRYDHEAVLVTGKIRRVANLSPAFTKDLGDHLSLRFVPEATGEPDTLSPEDIFHYAYAIFHSPMYRERYAPFLKKGFPRLPLTTNVPLFRQLGTLGGELVAWHLLQHPELESVGAFMTTFPVGGDNRVEKGHPKYDEARRRVYINEEQYFAGIARSLHETQRLMREIDAAIDSFPLP